jgi:hypothetical protein
MPIEHRFYINLDKEIIRKKEFLKLNDDGFTRWRATERSEVSLEVDQKMVSRYNLKRETHLGRCACLMSHLSLLQHIVDHKLNNVLICEDDAAQVAPVPEDYPLTGLIYVGGFFHQNRMTDDSPVDHQSSIGMNEKKDDFRIICMLAYIIPSWHVAHAILQYFKDVNRFKAIDITINDVPIDVYYNYPASFIEDPYPSAICPKRKHATEFYEFR